MDRDHAFPGDSLALRNDEDAALGIPNPQIADLGLTHPRQGSE